MTCYHYAARNGLAEMVETLAERGAKLNITDKDGNTGIHIASEYVRHAMSGIDIKKRELEQSKKNYEETVARCKGRNMTDEETEQYIKNTVSNPPAKAQQAYDAAVNLVEDYFRVVKAFAKGGVDIDEKNEYGRSALDVAVQNGAKKIAAFLSGDLTDEGDSAAGAASGIPTHQAAEKGDIKAIEAIAGTGVDMNSLKDKDDQNMGGCTALAIAAANVQAGAAEALLSYGADPSFKDGNGRMAAYYLVFSTSSGGYEQMFANIPKIINALVSAGMDINAAVDDDSNTLLLLACKSASGGSYNKHSKKGDIFYAVMKHNPDINIANRFGETALMYACADDFEIMENP